MKFELSNAKGEVVVSADVQVVDKWWIDHGPVIYKGDTSLLVWSKTPASGEIVASVFHKAARKHDLFYKCDTPQILPD